MQSVGLWFACTEIAMERNLSQRVLAFAVRIGKLVDQLPRTVFGQKIVWQLSDSGTSPVGNYEEACAAESRRDFIHKMSICYTKLRESRGWLRFTKAAELLPDRFRSG